MPTQEGANDVDGIAARLAGLINPEQEQPTGEAPTGSEDEGETPTGDTKPTFKTMLGEQEIELQVLTEGIDPETVRLGTLAEADYRKKTMALADERKGVETKLESLGGALEDAHRILEADLSELESGSLREDYPEEYLRQLEAIRSRTEKYTKAREEWAKAHEESQREKQVQEWQKLNTALPSWLDEKVRDKDVMAIGEQLQKTGYTSDEIKSLSGADHRLLLLARKAAMFDAIQAEDIESKRDRTPLKTARAGAKDTPGAGQVADLKAKLRKSGHMRDAAAVFKEMMR